MTRKRETLALLTVLVLVAAVILVGALQRQATRTAGAAGGHHHTKHHSKHHAKHRPQAHFVIATFNVLGNSHTQPSGNKAELPSGRSRAVRAAALLQRHEVDVVGLQELQPVQLETLKAQFGSRFRFYPGFADEPNSTQNSLAWRRQTWRAVETRTVGIPYFDGKERPSPLVLLQHRRSGLRVWFLNVHNPASTRYHPDQQRWRDAATGKEIRIVKRLVRRTHRPVVLTGDMNERAAYFCRVTTEAPMTAARTQTSSDRRCHADQPRWVDWIFGTRNVAFPAYVEDAVTRRTGISDHPLVVSRARITGDGHPRHG